MIAAKTPAGVRRSYAARGWHLWTNGTSYYAVTSHGETPGCGQTLAAKTPVGCLQKVLAHPSMRGRS